MTAAVQTSTANVYAQDSSPLAFAARRDDAAMVGMVKEALEKGRVKLAYQPVVVAGAVERIAFYEGLVRVLDPKGFVIAAADFIPLVEESEIGRHIDCAALSLGLEALSQNPDLRLSVNMSARSIGYPKWGRVLQSALSDNPKIAERLILEISEGSAILGPEIVLGFMREWQGRGITFAMDDFGAKYSAIRYFGEFRFDVVKIDGCFIQGIAHNRNNQVIVAALLAIAKQFDLLSVAENVESKADAAFLRSLGVDLLQGYAFGEPTVTPDFKF